MIRRFIISISVLLLGSVSISFAQGTCPQILELALNSLAENCETLGRNTACYGYNLVSAEFIETVDDTFFSEVADTAQLDILASIQTAEMNTDLSQWGVAVMNLQANIPNSLPGQAVKFILLGDVEVESAVDPDSTFEGVDPITVTMSAGANIRSGPSLNFNVIAGVVAGDTMQVDATNEAGDWYRTVVGSRIGWIFSDLVESSPELANLPVSTGSQRSLMQAFYLRTGFGSPACEEAPSDTLIVQGPQNIEIDLTVNGADIRLGSTIAMRILQPGNIIEFTVVEGKLTIPGGGPNGTDLVVYEGFRTTACLTEPDDLGVDGNSNDRLIGCEFSQPEFVPDTALGESFCVLENVPEGLLNYSVDLFCPQNGDEPITIVRTEEPDSTPDPTEEPDDTNLCSPGNAWDDGRCKTDYDWEAGYYFGLYEEGLITLEQIPAAFYTEPTPEPTPEPTKEKKKEKKPKFCSDYYDSGSEVWEIYEIATGEPVGIETEDPGYPSCGSIFQ